MDLWNFGIIACYYGRSYSVMVPLEFVSLILVIIILPKGIGRDSKDMPLIN